MVRHAERVDRSLRFPYLPVLPVAGTRRSTDRYSGSISTSIRCRPPVREKNRWIVKKETAYLFFLRNKSSLAYQAANEQDATAQGAAVPC
ncbi:hypothetical protein Enr13x_51690 [Stieleria neptunia]|uniref:Uncharacterized protein n=1 Tax=Stieleria neptunia TaxID=2527979 RepID=A0A518HWS9_9BACT|nr:hypothetical protein Enr13x_51690 [Stieleria neptunia]